MNIYSGGGLPRFYSSDRLSLVTSEHAVLLCFVAAILTALNGGEACGSRCDILADTDRLQSIELSMRAKYHPGA